MKKHLKSLFISLMMVVIWAVPQMTQAMNEGEQTEESVVPVSVLNLPSDVERPILEIVVMDSCYKFGHAGNIGLVCTAWKNFITKEWRYTSPLYPDLTVNLQTKCREEIFRNGKLKYRPNPNSDVGMITLRIYDLPNPLNGTFDLSECGDTGKYLSIYTGYRKEVIPENKDKVEIWFAPRWFIEQELKAGRAQQFKEIFVNWKPHAQIGIFWTWGGWDNLNWFNYLVSSDNLTLSSKNLHDYWWEAGGGAPRGGLRVLRENFMFILNNQN